MILALGIDDGQELVLAKALRLGQHRSRDGDVVVGAERFDNLLRRIGDRGHTTRKCGARLGFNAIRKTGDHVAEHRHMFVRVLIRATHEKVRDATKGGGATISVAAFDCSLKIGDQHSGVCHSGKAFVKNVLDGTPGKSGAIDLPPNNRGQYPIAPAPAPDPRQTIWGGKAIIERKNCN